MDPFTVSQGLSGSRWLSQGKKEGNAAGRAVFGGASCTSYEKLNRAISLPHCLSLANGMLLPNGTVAALKLDQPAG